jgi:hypothetical protein
MVHDTADAVVEPSCGTVMAGYFQLKRSGNTWQETYLFPLSRFAGNLRDMTQPGYCPMFELMFVRERVRKGFGSAENDALTVIVLCNRADLEAKDIVFENSGRYLPGGQ